MKELTIEQKAKRYDKAIEGAKGLIDFCSDSELKTLEYVFPELKESEDEKIRKELIDFVKSRLAGFPQCEKFIAWLEKQGEHKRFRDFIQIGDKVTRNEAGILINLSQLERIAKPRKAKSADKVELEKQGEKPAKNIFEAWKDMRLEVYQQASGNRHEPNCSDDTTKMFSLNDIDEIIEKLSEQKPTDKVEQKFIKVKYAGSEYNVLEIKDIAGVTYYGIEDEPNHIDYVLPNNCEIVSEQKPAWSEEDEEILNLIIARLHSHQNVEAEEYNKDYHWFKSLKDRVQPQQKKEWGEEDKKMFVNIKACLRNANKDYSAELDWLKSLRPQKQWKPSEEQLKSLQEVIDEGHFTSYPNTLETLYEQLKQL